jgi:hypothetical protein
VDQTVIIDQLEAAGLTETENSAERRLRKSFECRSEHEIPKSKRCIPKITLKTSRIAESGGYSWISGRTGALPSMAIYWKQIEI